MTSRIKAVGRITLVAALVCTLLLGANFALTVTAVVSNKDVYVNTDLKGLVTANGERISVDVTERITSVFEVPYQHMRVIANTQMITIPRGEDILILKPSMFQFSKVQHGYELSMKTADGTTLTWGPPTQFGSNGVLTKAAIAERSISITMATGEITKMTGDEGRRLPEYTSSASSWGSDKHDHDVNIGCSQNVKGNSLWGNHQQVVHGYTPHKHGDGPWPLAVYLAGTHADMDSSMADLQVHAMVDLGWVGVQIEYNDRMMKWNCDGWRLVARQVSSCIDEVCSHETSYIGCSSGVAVYGWSQGGIVALFVGTPSDKITAALSFDGTIHNFHHDWHGDNVDVMTTCFAQHKSLSNTRNRIIVGAKDGYMGGDGDVDSGTYGTGDPQTNAANAAIASGHTCDNADGTHMMTCLDSYGAGYVVVTEAESQITFLGHWWFAIADDAGVFTGWNAKFAKSQAEWGKKKTFGFLDTRGKDSGH